MNDIKNYNHKNDLYFIPNGGGMKSNDITQFNAFFIDLDCGRDENGNYYPIHHVKQYKHTQLEKLKIFDIPPNALVETRNGYHAYWFIKETITKEQWQEIEKFLVKYFNADSKVCSPAHQMRIPGTWWMKNRDEPFLCKLVFCNNAHKLVASLSDLAQKYNSASKTTSKYKFKKSIPRKSSSIIFYSYKELFDYLTKSVSIFDYLSDFYGLNSSNRENFCCILHDDKHPSASVFKTDSGIELYYCHSDKCGFIGNIIQLVAYKENCSRSEAITLICRNLNITFKKDEKSMNLILDNIATINDDIYNSHRDLYGVTYRYIPTLKELHYIALENMMYADTSDGLIFSASVSYVAKRLGRNTKKDTGADISLLCLLKLIDKIDLDDNNVSEKYKEYIKRFQGEQPRYINVYSLPEYTYNKLSECNDMAKAFKDKNLRKRYFTYESVANAFGKETADRVFPQVKGKNIPKTNEHLLEVISILLERDKYFTQKTIMAYYKHENRHFNEVHYVKQLPAIIQSLGLTKIKASKKIKEEYGILSAGYPIIYVKQGK